MALQAFHETSQLNVIGYDELPLDISNRARDQILTLKLKPYNGNEQYLLNAVSKALEGHDGPAILMISDECSDDYTAINILTGAMATPSNLFDIFMELGVFPKPTHGWYPEYDI